MKRITALVLSVCLLLLCSCSLADDPYRMLAYDGGTEKWDWSTNTFFQDREDETGISFLFTQYNDYTQWKNEMQGLLTDEGAGVDVIFKGDLTTSEIQQLYSDGLIIDLKPYLAEYAPNLTKLLEENPEWEKAITLPDGSIPALPSINQVQNNNAMWVNKKWLDACHLEMPSTRDEFVEMLRAFKTKDPNMNGKKDEIPLSFVSLWDLKFLSHMFGFVMNDYGICMESGQVRYMVSSEKNREFITWLSELWQEGLLWSEGFTSPDNMRTVTDSKATKTYGMFFATTPLALVPSDWTDDYEALMPAHCEGKQIYRKLQNDVILGAFALTPHCKNPEKLVAWVDYLYSPEGSHRAQSGKAGVDYSVDSDGKWAWNDESTTIISEILPKHTISEGGNIPGFIDSDFQRNYDDEQAVKAVEALLELKEYEVSTYPQVYLTKDERARIKEIQNTAGAYAEQMMVWFVTGEKEITDENWNEFVTGLDERNVGEMVEIFQKAYDRQYN